MPNTKEKGKLIEVLSKHIPYGYATLCLIAEELMADGVRLEEKRATDVREKLVELLKQTEINKINGHTALAQTCFTPNVFENMATNLIAHGVTLQEWISVKDRLPEIDTQVLCFTGSGVQLAMYEGNDKWFTNYHSYTLEGKNLFTHWMPLPQPPKGE